MVEGCDFIHSPEIEPYDDGRKTIRLLKRNVIIVCKEGNIEAA
ncbi:MAG: hypothetical protein K0Q73_7264 [Paenibacillus sp.]|jgi:hypothetical protein|nr:hypothetical protein [Paenibacillus sp.]